MPFAVYVQPGVGGAYHCSCAATTFFVDADPQLGGGFFAAEAVEVFEAAIDLDPTTGRLCRFVLNAADRVAAGVTAALRALLAPAHVAVTLGET